MRKEILMDAGIDVDAAVRRMGGRVAMAEKYLKKFLQDPSFQQMQQAQNTEELLRAVHTLKGVSANLGMEALSESCAEMVGMLRGGNMETAKIQEQIRDQYEMIVKAIQEAEESK